MSKSLIISQAIDKICKDKNKIYLDFNCIFNSKYLNSIDEKIFEGYGNTNELIKSDSVIVGKIYNQIIQELCKILNKNHSEKFSVRQWEVLIGTWLFSYVKTFYFRAKSLDTCIRKENVETVKISEFSNYDFSTAETGGIFECMWNNEWDLMFKSRIIKNLEIKNVNLEVININQTFKSKYKFFEAFKKNKKKYYASKILDLFNIINFKQKIVIDNTYLGLKNEALLQVFNKQFPRILAPKKLNYPKKNLQLRKELSSLLKASNSIFEKIIKKFIFDDIPLVHLEGYQDLKKTVQKNNWPNNPRLIFTSNSFYFDEQFKYYVAKSIPKAKYIVGQHGNGYGEYITHDYLPEYRTCDYFLAWGKPKNKKDISTFNFILANKKINYNFKNKKILMVNRTLGYPVETFEKIQSFKKHYVDKISFLKNLNKSLQTKIIYRLHHTHNFRTPNEEGEIRSIFPSMEVDDGKSDLYRLINKSNLVVFTYYSTGFLELISSDVPSLCLQENILNLIKDEYKNLFYQMIDAKILFLNFKDLEIFLEKNYIEIHNWWMSDRIRILRNQISSLLSKKPKGSALSEVNKILNNLK
tara:strand:- start:571 stop:2319 length:1749 start_codon:yes stop_codon:yes gene_type:complete